MICESAYIFTPKLKTQDDTFLSRMKLFCPLTLHQGRVLPVSQEWSPKDRGMAYVSNTSSSPGSSLAIYALEMWAILIPNRD